MLGVVSRKLLCSIGEKCEEKKYLTLKGVTVAVEMFVRSPLCELWTQYVLVIVVSALRLWCLAWEVATFRKWGVAVVIKTMGPVPKFRVLK